MTTEERKKVKNFCVIFFSFLEGIMKQGRNIKERERAKVRKNFVCEKVMTMENVLKVTKFPVRDFEMECIHFLFPTYIYGFLFL